MRHPVSLPLVFMLICLPPVTLDAQGSLRQLPEGPSGGTGGEPFVDPGTLGSRLVMIRVRSGAFIDAIQLVFAYKAGGSCANGTVGPWHGGEGGDLSEFPLACDEDVVEIGGKYANYVEHLFVKTSKGRVMHWGGSGGIQVFDYPLPRNASLKGVWGRAGVYVDAIGPIMLVREP
jgi:hypothetical protein